jgi:hypothetical protein
MISAVRLRLSRLLSVSMIISMVIIIMLMQITMIVLHHISVTISQIQPCVYLDKSRVPTWFITATNIYIYRDDIFGCNSMLSLRQAGCKRQANDNQSQDLHQNCQYRRPLIELIES